MFDGSEVRARHILVPVTDGKKDDAIAKLNAVKKSIETKAAQELSNLPASADAIKREQARATATEKAFADAAGQISTCPSKKDGGDLGFFPRAGAMVEPFAQAAFSLKRHHVSDPVGTDFGYHLILTVDTKPGKNVKFEQVKPFVQEVYGERLREAVLKAYRPRSKVEIVERK
jgi:parvulin-like peptidyl-prolyl isomerase